MSSTFGATRAPLRYSGSIPRRPREVPSMPLSLANSRRRRVSLGAIVRRLERRIVELQEQLTMMKITDLNTAIDGLEAAAGPAVTAIQDGPDVTTQVNRIAAVTKALTDAVTPPAAPAPENS